MPVLHAASVQEYLDFGLHAFAMSRYSGLWIGFKVLNETVDSLRLGPYRSAPHRDAIPADFVLPPDGLHIRWPDDWAGQEAPGRQHSPAGRAGLLARQQARPADDGPARCALRHHDRRQVLSRRAPGARRARHRRRRGRAHRARRLQGRHGLAARDRRRDGLRRGQARDPGASRRSSRSSSSSSRTRCSMPRPTAAPSSSARSTSSAKSS